MLIRVPESAGTLYERIQYPAGELQIRFTKKGLDQLADSVKVEVLCRNAHQNLMELMLLSDALHHIEPFLPSTLILPYLPYGRADRRFVEGDCNGLRTFGNILNWTAGYDRIKTLDVHSSKALKYVAKLENVSARPFVSKAIADICDNGGHPIVLLPDEGAKRYGLAGALHCSKKRDPVTGKLSGFEVPELDNRHDVLIVDDICDGGGTFIGLAQKIHGDRYLSCNCSDLPHLMGLDEHEKGCPMPRTEGPRKKLYLYVTHGIFSQGMESLLKYFEKIYTTDSIHPRPGETGWDVNWFNGGKPRLEVFDCEAELFGKTA